MPQCRKMSNVLQRRLVTVRRLTGSFIGRYNRVVTRYMRSGITAPGSGITTLGIGISSVLVESGIKIVNVFGIRDQNSQCFCDQGLKFSTFLWSGIKIWGKNTGSVMKKYTLLRPCYIYDERRDNHSKMVFGSFYYGKWGWRIWKCVSMYIFRPHIGWNISKYVCDSRLECWPQKVK